MIKKQTKLLDSTEVENISTEVTTETDAAEEKKERQVLQVEDPVWVWTIKYWRVTALLA